MYLVFCILRNQNTFERETYWTRSLWLLWFSYCSLFDYHCAFGPVRNRSKPV